MRHVLDQAPTVADTVDAFRSFNLDGGSGLQVHHLVADAKGRAAVLEFDSEGLHVIRGADRRLDATNLRVAPLAGDLVGSCPRYDRIHAALGKTGGILTTDEAMGLLREVASEDDTYGTQWSGVCNFSHRRVHVVMGRKFERVYPFQLQQ